MKSTGEKKESPRAILSHQIFAACGIKIWVSRAKDTRVAHHGTLRKALRVPFSFCGILSQASLIASLGKANAFIGAGSVAIEAVRMIKGEQVEF